MFKSYAQLRKFGSLVKQGKISESTFKEWLSKTDKSTLPEKIGKSKKHKSKSIMSFFNGQK